MKNKLIRMLVCVFACMLLLFAAAAAQADELEVHFVNVGRNDGILIRCGGEDVFIDAGGYYRGEVCTEYMKRVGVNKLKYYIGTHAHDDHVGGAPVIITAFQPDVIYQPHKKVKDVIIKNIRNANQKDIVRNANYVNMTIGQQINVGGATLTCLGPVKVRDLEPSWGTENENSLVLKLTYGETDILLTGDATNATMLAMDAANPGCLQADVYKNAHHNQYTRENVFSLINPQYTIFSTANGYMPDSSYKALLNRYQSIQLSTSDNHCGTLILRTDGKDIRFESEKRVETVTLNADHVQIYEGKSTKVKASVKPYKSTKKLLLYSSSDPSVATVDENGKITGVGRGEAVITVRDGMGAYAECRVTVNPATLTMRKTELKVRQGSKVSASWKIEPSGSKAVIQWASEDEGIATVDQKGRITGVYPGVTRITATMPSGQVSAVTLTVEPVKVSSVSISPSSVKMTLGESRTVSAKVSPKNATWPEVVWSSADESIVTIDANGNLRAVGVGKTSITATTREGKSRTVKITVNPVFVKKILLKADQTANLVGGVTGRNQVQLSYSVEPFNATIQEVEWSTSNKKIATVDENGVVTGHKDGSVTITCKATDGSKRYTRIKLKFGKNELKRTVRAEKGQFLVQAEQIIFRINGQLEVKMTYSNRTGMKQEIVPNGWLVLITPEGEQIPLMPVAEKARMLSNGSSRSYTYKVPQAVSARINGLDLTRCDAAIMNLNGR